MKLGFVSAILADLGLEEVLKFAADEGFGCVEVMCWPPGGAERRYAGVTHIDVTRLDQRQADAINEMVRRYKVEISGLGYYPNPLDPNPEHRKVVVDHLRKVIEAAPKLDVHIVNTFIGRDPTRSIDDNWPLFCEIWPGIIELAEKHDVQIGIENCPMLFSKDEWPGGKNLAVSPAIWDRMFREIRSRYFGLNFDPSHLVFQFIDAARCVREFGKRIVHFHAKDARIDQEKLYQVGALDVGWHTPKLPGMGDVAWGPLFSALTDAGYNGAVCIEVEDRAYEGSLEARKRSLRQSKRFLEAYVA